MAVVKLGGVVVGVSGTIGGLTFSRNKSGPTAKVWARGPRQRTPFQSEARGYMSVWGNLWRSLSSGAQTDWNILAASPPEVDYDRFGSVVLRSGFQWLVRINQRMVLLGGPPVVVAPASVSVAAPVIGTFTAAVYAGSASCIHVTYDPAAWLPGELAIWFLAMTPSTGVAEVKRGFQMVGISAPNGTTSTDLGWGAVAKFGYWPAGWLATLHVYKQSSTGIRSIAVAMRATVTP